MCSAEHSGHYDHHDNDNNDIQQYNIYNHCRIFVIVVLITYTTDRYNNYDSELVPMKNNEKYFHYNATTAITLRTTMILLCYNK